MKTHTSNERSTGKDKGKGKGVAHEAVALANAVEFPHRDTPVRPEIIAGDDPKSQVRPSDMMPRQEILGILRDPKALASFTKDLEKEELVKKLRAWAVKFKTYKDKDPGLASDGPKSNASMGKRTRRAVEEDDVEDTPFAKRARKILPNHTRT